MSRRHEKRVPVHLDSQGIGSLPIIEVRAILRGVEELIARGGRTKLPRSSTEHGALMAANVLNSAELLR